MKELLTAIEYNLGILALRGGNLRQAWDGFQYKAEAEAKIKKVNELLYEISDVLEQLESEMEL